MWWPAESDAEAALRETVQRLLDRYQEQLSAGSNTPLRGVGAGPAEQSGPRPWLEKRAFAGAHGGDVVEWSYQDVEPWYPLVLVDAASMQPIPPGVRRLNWQQVDPRSLAAAALQAMEPPSDCLVEPIGPIVPTVAPGCVAAAQGFGSVTVGLPVTITDPAWAHLPAGFLTVAHGTPDRAQSPAGKGPAVTVVNRAGAQLTGEVAYWDESARTAYPNPADDIALVALPQGSLAGGLLNIGTQGTLSGPPYPTLQVDLYGGRSRNVLGQVSGALRALGDSTWQWRDLWDLGATMPVMQKGDSGSLAVGPAVPHSVFGHFVGGALPPPGRGNGFTSHWVQDLGQVLAQHPGLSGMITF